MFKRFRILFLLLLSAAFFSGCNTRYGYEYNDEIEEEAAAPELHKLELACKLNTSFVQLKESQKRILRDYAHTIRTGERNYFKQYCGYSKKEKAVLFPTSRASFPCLSWGVFAMTGKTELRSESSREFLQQYFSLGAKEWGPLLGIPLLANIFFGTGDLLYYTGGSIWSLLAVPSYYIWNRSTACYGNWGYRSSPPEYIYTFMSSPFFNLFFPGYIPPFSNHGSLLIKQKNYTSPVKLKSQLLREVPQVLTRDLDTKTLVSLSYAGKTHTSHVTVSGRVPLPFKLYPLPERQEKMMIEVKNYKSKLQKSPADLKKEISFNTLDHLSYEHLKLYRIVKNPELDYMKRFRAVYKLKPVIRPEDWKRFEADPGAFLSR